MTDTLNPALLDLLVCPYTKAPLIYDKDSAELISPKSGLVFPVKDGIPMLCADAARPLTPEEEDALDLSMEKPKA